MAVCKVKRQFLEKYLVIFIEEIIMCLSLAFMLGKLGVVLILIFYMNVTITFLIDLHNLNVIFKDVDNIKNVIFNFKDKVIFTKKEIFSIGNHVFKIKYKDIIFLSYIKYDFPILASYPYSIIYNKIIIHGKQNIYYIYCDSEFKSEQIEYFYRIIKEYNPNVKTKQIIR